MWFLLRCFLIIFINSVFFVWSLEKVLWFTETNFDKVFAIAVEHFGCHYHHRIIVYHLHIVPLCKIQLNFCSSHLCICWKLGSQNCTLRYGLVKWDPIGFSLVYFNFCYLLFIKLWIISIADSENPKSFSLFFECSWLMESKALDRSIKDTETCLFSFIDLRKNSVQ